MRVAALYDIHANLPALDAVLAELEDIGPDLVVVGGDVAAGPLPVETLDRLAGLGGRVAFVRGNGDREMVAAFDAGARADELEDPVARGTAWAAAQLEPRHRDALAAYQPTVSVDVDGLGPTLFCHGSPRDDAEIITTATDPARLAPMLAAVTEATVVCGHTHRQFDRRAEGHRVVNAGAVGMPYEGTAAAFWALLGPHVELRRTDYDVAAAIAALRASGYPDVDEMMLRESLIEPADPDWVAGHFERQALARD
jgi:predicted phosphodiesterase